MADGPLENVVQELRRIAGLTEAATLADGRLLEVFSATSEPAALEVLVRRYGPMVFGVCRRVLRHTQDAEDAFQATFLVLVRKAAGLRRGETLGNWLYGVAYRTALQARTRSARRRRFEAGAPPMDTENSALESAARSEIQALLDRELNRLPEKFRSPIILCDLLGKTLKQAAVELRCPEGTVSSRLTRGRERLKKQLEHHAPTLAEGSAPLMAIGPSMIQALPAGLCMNTVKAAVLVANGTTMASLSPSVAAIVQGVMKSMLITKLKPAVMLFVGFGLLSGMTFVVASGMGVGSGPGDVADKGKVEKPAAVVAVAEREAPVVAEVQAPPKVQEKQKKRLLYDGKDFNAWLDVLQNELKPEVRVDAIKALGAFGVNGYAEEATVAIIEEMRKHDAKSDPKNKVVAAARTALQAMGDVALAALAKEMDSKNANDRLMAVGSVYFGFDAKMTQPILLRALKDQDPDVRDAAVFPIFNATRFNADFIRGLTVQEKQALVAALDTVVSDAKSEWAGRNNALIILGWLGPDAKAALPTLIALLEDDRGGPGPWYVADAMSKIGPSAKEAVPALIRVLGKPPQAPSAKGKTIKGATDWAKMGTYAAIALGAIGPEARDAVPALVAVLNHNDGAQDKATNVVPGDPPLSRRKEAAKALAKIGKDGIVALIDTAALGLKLPSVPLKKSDLNDPNISEAMRSGEACKVAIDTLAELGPASKDAVPVLMKLVERQLPVTLENNAAIALGRIGPDAKEAVPSLVKRLKSFQKEEELQSWPLIGSLVGALGGIGPAAKEAVPFLTELRDATKFGSANESGLRALKEAVAKALEKIQK